jgi:hypothetical protein
MNELEGRQGMSEQPRLERGFRRLLACYPRAYRRENEEEILAVLMACAQDGQRRPGLAASADLIRGALRMRLWPASRPPRTVRAAVRLMWINVVADLAFLVIEVATAGRVRAASARRYPPWAAAAVYHVVNARLATSEVNAVIGIGLWVLLAWALVRGRNLARFAFAARFGLDCWFMLQAVGQGALVNAPADMAAGAVRWLLALSAGVLLFAGASNRYYRRKPRLAPRRHRIFGTA